MDHREELVESVRASLKEGEATHSTGRRSFLKNTLVLSAAALPLEWLARGFPSAIAATAATYGPLLTKADDVTGANYLKVPNGFSYQSFGRRGALMDDGVPTPGYHDGMGVCRVEDDLIYLVRNHEARDSGRSFGAGVAPTYDTRAPGGTTNLVFDTLRERWDSSYASLAGTSTNCSGGATPWGTWLTCEEATSTFGKKHGYVFEVPTDGTRATAQPIIAMGRFFHEAAVVVNRPTSPQHGEVYMTEDVGGSTDPAGFYRFKPTTPGNLAAGGVLYMLKIKGKAASTIMQKETKKLWDVEWVSVPTPQNTGVFARGKQKGGAHFLKLEGAWYDPIGHAVWFVSSSMGVKKYGRIYKLDITTQQLHMVYESVDRAALEFPDNISVLSDGSALICEEPSSRRAKLQMLNPTGTNIFPLVESISSGELCGVTFHGKWLFLNNQDLGLTFAITGPWENETL